MQKNEAFPKRFLTKEDGEPAFKAEIDRVAQEEIENFQTGALSMELVVYLRNTSREIDLRRGIVIKPTNWALIAGIRGENPEETDTDNWPGTVVVLWNDKSVVWAKGVGGLRFRAPIESALAKEPAPSVPPPPDDAVPF